MEIATVVKYNRTLDSVEGQIVQLLERNEGKYHRSPMLGAYCRYSLFDEGTGRPLNAQIINDALESLDGKGLVSMNTALEIILDQDELEIYRELSEYLEQYQKLIQKAVETQQNSWSPYSKFKVGAAILTTEEEIITGTNFENASYGVTICAERGAIGAAVKEGQLNPEKEKYIKAIVAVLPTNDYGRPCGACRQAIYEFSGPDGCAYVVMANPQGQADVKKIRNILPDAFGPFDLGIFPKPGGKSK